MFKNLQAEFARINIKPYTGIANTLNCSERTARNKLNGITAISISEAQKIKLALFPSLTLEYLFATE